MFLFRNLDLLDSLYTHAMKWGHLYIYELDFRGKQVRLSSLEIR